MTDFEKKFYEQDSRKYELDKNKDFLTTGLII